MKNILITGANKGIGLEIARQLLKKGNYVIISGRNEVRLLEAMNSGIGKNRYGWIRSS